MRKQMPGFYAKNVAKNAQREYLKTGKTRAERMDEAREQ